MQRLLPLIAVLSVSAQPALAGITLPPNGLPSSSILSLTAAGVVAAIYLARRKR